MKDFTVAIYCFIDDLLQKMQPNHLDKRRKLTDAQVIATAIVSAKYFYGNQWTACRYMKEHWGFEMPDKGNFNRILHRLSDLIARIFQQLSEIIKHLNLESVYIIGSFPVPVCKNIRISRSKLLKGKEFRGYNASKREFFYGFKVHMITTGEGIPAGVLIMAGSIHDNTALQTMDIGLPKKSRLYADAAYLNGGIKGLLSESRMVSFRIPDGFFESGHKEKFGHTQYMG